MYDYHNETLDLSPENPPASPAEETIPFFRVIRHSRPNFLNLAEQLGGWESAGISHGTTALSIVALVRTAAGKKAIFRVLKTLRKTHLKILTGEPEGCLHNRQSCQQSVKHRCESSHSKLSRRLE